MTELLHMKDNYAKRFDAKIIDIVDGGVVLNRTAFYPKGGGLPSDRGMLVVDGQKHDVNKVARSHGKIVHFTDTAGLEEGMTVHGEIEWDRRYRLMRAHTAAHLLEALMYDKTGALIGSGRVSLDRSYLGFTLENMDRDLIRKVVEEANKKVNEGAEVSISFMPREEALEEDDLVKLASKLPPAVKELRIVTIEGIERQACGGPHVENIDEIGKIEVIELQNKGKNNRRLYYKVI